MSGGAQQALFEGLAEAGIDGQRQYQGGHAGAHRAHGDQGNSGEEAVTAGTTSPGQVARRNKPLEGHTISFRPARSAPEVTRAGGAAAGRG